MVCSMMKCLHWKKESFPKRTDYGQPLGTLINDMLLSVVLVVVVLVVVRVTSINADNSNWRVFTLAF